MLHEKISEVRKELKNRGYTIKQAESPLVPVVVDIVLGGDFYQSEDEKRRHLDRQDDQIRSKESEIEKLDKDIAEARKRLKEARDEYQSVFNKQVRETLEYMREFEKQLHDCDTPEGRDRMRLAQVFVSSVHIDSKYDNTAFIIGLASLLSGGSIGAMRELKKINPKLFKDFEMYEQEEDTIPKYIMYREIAKPI